MQRLEVSCAVRFIYTSLGAKGLTEYVRHAGCTKSAASYKTLHPSLYNLAWKSTVELRVSVKAKAK